MSGKRFKDFADHAKKYDKAVEELGVLNDSYNAKKQELLLENEKQSVVENSLIEVGRDLECNAELIEEVKSRLEENDSKLREASVGGKKLEQDKQSAAETHQNADNNLLFC